MSEQDQAQPAPPNADVIHATRVLGARLKRCDQYEELIARYEHALGFYADPRNIQLAVQKNTSVQIFAAVAQQALASRDIVIPPPKQQPAKPSLVTT